MNQSPSQPNVVNPLQTFTAQSVAAWIPDAVDEISLASNGSHLYVAYATYNTAGAVPNTQFTCPSTATTSVPWRVKDLFYSSTYTAATAATDTAWRRCVGASSVSGGTAHNRAVSRPGLAVNPVTGELYVAVSKKFGSTDTHSRIQFSVEEKLGAFNGLTALPRYDGGFLSAWGDQRDTMTRVWTAQMQHYP